MTIWVTQYSSIHARPVFLSERLDQRMVWAQLTLVRVGNVAVVCLEQFLASHRREYAFGWMSPSTGLNSPGRLSRSLISGFGLVHGQFRQSLEPQSGQVEENSDRPSSADAVTPRPALRSPACVP